jgi:hypothetical protein
VVDVVTGFGVEIGEPLVAHPKVAKVAFTGGELSGQHIYESAATGLKRVTLELGGKSSRSSGPSSRRYSRSAQPGSAIRGSEVAPVISIVVVGGGQSLGNYHMDEIPRVNDVIEIQKSGAGHYQLRVKDVHGNAKPILGHPVRSVDEATVFVTIEDYRGR